MKLSLILFESKQSIINMGFPEILAKYFYERFGNLAPTIAKWWREYHRNYEGWGEEWWLQ